MPCGFIVPWSMLARSSFRVNGIVWDVFCLSLTAENRISKFSKLF